ncbi:MAG: FKBP-type peptidyl-prolyl cis-trans isomerase [Chitinophagaceae bacterium]|nr:FKBP-type peptidyl-prolyl cis-trans isomerase [Chitinophagaceae bacterium]
MATVLVGATSCGGNKTFKKTKDGVEYLIVTDEKGENAKVGDIIEYHMLVKIGDSVMFESRKMNDGKPVEMPLQENPQATKSMDPTEVIKMLSAGDSAVIRVELDSMARKVYTFAKPTDKLEFQFKMVSVKSKEKAEAELKEKDDKALTEYFAANGITAQKTASGLYYVVTKPGTGALPAAGQTVKVMYTGKLMDGKMFDSNIDPQFQHTEPLEFPLGKGNVIPGWDEGIALLNKGAKGTLYVPSTLAYGAQSPSPLIPANSILIFDVELLDFK